MWALCSFCCCWNFVKLFRVVDVIHNQSNLAKSYQIIINICKFKTIWKKVNTLYMFLLSKYRKMSRYPSIYSSQKFTSEMSIHQLNFSCYWYVVTRKSPKYVSISFVQGKFPIINFEFLKFLSRPLVCDVPT